MKDLLQRKTTAWLLTLVAATIAVVPFHGFLTVWLASLVGHYTALRLWKEALLLILILGVIYLFIKVPRTRWDLLSYKLPWLIAAYSLLQVICGVVALLMHHASLKAVGYGWIINLRFLLFFLVVWALTLQLKTKVGHWRQIVLWPMAIVVLIGLLQYFVLPYDFLKHFGYNQNTIFPYSTINHNIRNLRVMSTLRGANPLGAYLVTTLSIVAVLWYKHKKTWQYGVLFATGLITLMLTFSRSAWIGLSVSLAVIVWASLRSEKSRQKLVVVGGIAVLLVAGLFIGFRHNTAIQDAIFHTDDHSKVAVSSNDNHASALRSGFRDVVHEPFGMGPGTAGPASVYNTHGKVRLAENYFVQIGQETGWIGILLFAAINIVAGRALWRRRQQSLALGLFASLIGLTIVNLLSHAWADDTLAYLWWGLAGMAIAVDLTTKDQDVGQV